MKISKSIWLLQVCLLLYPGVLLTHESPRAETGAEKSLLKSTVPGQYSTTPKVGTGQISADHRKAVEAHVRHSDYSVLMLLRSANLSNIDSVLEAIDALKRSNEECAKRLDRCRKFDSAPNTADASKTLPDA